MLKKMTNVEATTDRTASYPQYRLRDDADRLGRCHRSAAGTGRSGADRRRLFYLLVGFVVLGVGAMIAAVEPR